MRSLINSNLGSLVADLAQSLVELPGLGFGSFLRDLEASRFVDLTIGALVEASDDEVAFAGLAGTIFDDDETDLKKHKKALVLERKAECR